MAGYHLEEIPKGVYGETSKILEEVLELMDADKQHNKVMVLNELSDIVGAIQGYLYARYGDAIAFPDLFTMAAATRRAFENGDRK